MSRHNWYYLFGLGLVSKLFISYMRRKQPASILRSGSKPRNSINEVLFFPDKEYPCPNIIRILTTNPHGPKVCYNPSCRRLHGDESSMLRFLDYLSKAEVSVNLCVYMFTQPAMATILKHLDSKGVQVRIITDGSDSNAGGDQIDNLRKSGIKIRSNKRGTGALMHHKFVVIDDMILLTGSFNWTSSAVVNNFEAVLITTDEKLLKPFILKFDELWLQFQ